MNNECTDLELRRRYEANRERFDLIEKTTVAVKKLVIESGISNKDAAQMFRFLEGWFIAIRPCVKKEAKCKQI